MIRKIIQKSRSKLRQNIQKTFPSKDVVVPPILSSEQKKDSDTKTWKDYTWLYPSLQHELEYHPQIQNWRNNGSQRTHIDFVHQIHKDIYQFPILSDSCIQKWCAELENIHRWRQLHHIEVTAPNSMNHYGFVLKDVDAQQPFLKMMQDVISPLSQILFPKLNIKNLETLHAFVVEYGSGLDRDLGFHIDASDITLNLCFGEQFLGGELYFEGRRCERHRQNPTQPEERFVYAHVPKYAILHAGKHRHGALSIERGTRRNLILWCHSQTLIDDSNCLEWCGEFERK